MYRSLYAAAVFESANVHTINSTEVINVAGDKILTYSKLFREGIPIPDSIIAMSPDATLKAYEQIGYPLIDKPPIGSWGRMVSLIRDLYLTDTLMEQKLLLQLVHSQLLVWLYLTFFLQLIPISPQNQ